MLAPTRRATRELKRVAKREESASALRKRCAVSWSAVKKDAPLMMESQNPTAGIQEISKKITNAHANAHT